MNNLDKVKKVIDRYCRKHLNPNGGFKGCIKKSCEDCTYNTKFAQDILDGLELKSE